MVQDVMLVHDMFLNPRSWEPWVAFFEARGFRCAAPAWPLHEGDPARLRESPPPGLGELSLQRVVDAMATAAGRLERPLLIGHSVGGLVVQILANRGLGCAAVPICSVAPNQMRSPALGILPDGASIADPRGGDSPCEMPPDEFHRRFANTLTRAESDAAWSRFALPGSRRLLRDCLGDAARIDLARPHPPLLFVAAGRDAVVPAEQCRRNADAYPGGVSPVDYQVFADRGHFICGEPGWQDVAEHVVDWFVAREPDVARRAGRATSGGPRQRWADPR